MRTARLLVALAVVLAVVLLFANRTNDSAPPDDRPASAVEPSAPPEVVKEEEAAGAVVAGRVVQADGSPATGARVTLSAPDYWEEFTPRTAEVASDGRFAFRSGEAAWDFVPLVVQAERGDLASERVSAETEEGPPQSDLGDLVLRPAVRPAAVVVDTGGKPLPGVQVKLHIWTGEDRDLEFGGQRTTDAAGRAEFAPRVRQADRTIEFKVSHPAARSVSREVSDDELAKGPIRFVLDPGVGVTGRVVAEDGTPVAGARVVLLGEYSRLWLPGTAPNDNHSNRVAVKKTGEDGRFLFPTTVAGDLGYALPVSRLILRAIDGDRASLWHKAVLGGKDGEVGDVVLQPGFTPTVVLQTGSGGPVAGATVELSFSIPLPGWPPGRSERYHILAARTDREGCAIFPVQLREEGWAVRLVAEHPDHEKVDRKVPIADLIAGPVTVTIRSGMTVVGRVLLADGTPAAGYEVVAGRKQGWIRMNDASKVEVGEDGGFEIHGVPEKQGVLAVRKSVLWITTHVDIAPDATGPVHDLGTIRLKAMGEIRGRVVDGEGRPVAGAWVNARRTSQGRGNRSDGTDDEGRFVIDGLPPGEYVVRARHELKDGTHLESVQVKGRPGGEEITIRLTKAGTVLFVFRSRGKPDAVLTVPSPEIDMGIGSWSGGGMLSRKRIRPRPGVHGFTVKVEGYRDVVFEDVLVSADRECVLDVFLEKTE